MSDPSEFESVYRQLRQLMHVHAEVLVCVRDVPGDYYLDSRYIMNNGKPLFFGAVRIRRSYVAYHLMPVYVFPELLSNLSPGLRARMQGKSCFNFKTADMILFDELRDLTASGFQRYREEGYI